MTNIRSMHYARIFPHFERLLNGRLASNRTKDDNRHPGRLADVVAQKLLALIAHKAIRAARAIEVTRVDGKVPLSAGIADAFRDGPRPATISF